MVGLSQHLDMRVSFARFQTAYHGRAQTALPFAMNSEFSRILSTEMVSTVGHPQSMFIENINNTNNHYCCCLLEQFSNDCRK